MAIVKAGNNVPNPIMRFEDGGFPDYVMSEVHRQCRVCCPHLHPVPGFALTLTGQDMVGIAQTGSGKTVGYLLPGIIHFSNQPYLERGDGPIVVLVLAPTRYVWLCRASRAIIIFFLSQGVDPADPKGC